jgi:sirohydrochlorin ferrochelatase
MSINPDQPSSLPATKHCLLLIAHGSRRSSSNDEVRRLTALLGEKVLHRFDATLCAFLELAEPSIPDAIQCCVDSGAEEIIILPYFLAAGRHVTEDIPTIVAAKKAQHPTIDIQMIAHLGDSPGLVDLLARSATR